MHSANSITATKPLLKELAQNLFFTSLACLVIAVLTSLLSPLSLFVSLKIAFSYGISITLLINLFLVWWPNLPAWLTAGSGMLLGLLLGTSVTVLEIHGSFITAFTEQPLQILGNLLIGFIFSFTVCYFFYIHYRTQKLQAEQAEKEKSLALSQLRLLQSQIEPHFLFNTLGNIQGLVDTQPDKAKQMIQALTALLRANLSQVRSDTTSLHQELSLVRAYLEIQQLRMGPRLKWAIQCPDSLHSVAIPPLLLQPLVENAIKHGLEPLPEGGEVSLEITAERDVLQILVRDSGQGFTDHPATRGEGLGLSNLRQRLELFYADQAKLTITQPEAGGTQIQLSFPLDIPGVPKNAHHLPPG